MPGITKYILTRDSLQPELTEALNRGEIVNCVPNENTFPGINQQSYFLKKLQNNEVAYFNSPTGYPLPDDIKAQLERLGLNLTVNVAIQVRRSTSGIFAGQFDTKNFNEDEIVNFLNKAAVVQEIKSLPAQAQFNTQQKQPSVFARFFKSAEKKPTDVVSPTIERKKSGPNAGG